MRLVVYTRAGTRAGEKPRGSGRLSAQVPISDGVIPPTQARRANSIDALPCYLWSSLLMATEFRGAPFKEGGDAFGEVRMLRVLGE